MGQLMCCFRLFVPILLYQMDAVFGIQNVRVCLHNSSNKKTVKGLQCLVLAAGWSGSGGLGAKEQGIQDPIKGGDIRDKWDQYKGVGVALDDPYENYRRNKSYSFIARMKARDECKWMFLSNLETSVDSKIIFVNPNQNISNSLIFF